MKFIRRFLLFIAALLLCAVFINAKTDFFYNISTYIPAMEGYPLVTRIISDASKSLSEFTSAIPGPSEILSMLKNEELPIDPEDVAHNAYISDSPMLSFYPNDNISIIVNEDNEYIHVFGVTSSEDKRHLIVNFSDAYTENLDQVSIKRDTNNQFSKKIKIPATDTDKIDITIFSGSKEYGQFSSWVLNLICLERAENGLWRIKTSPVYDNNKLMYEKNKSISEALKSTPSIQSDNPTIKSIASQLTSGIEGEYEKAVALHDWVCSYVYYDEDGLQTSETVPYYSTDVVNSRKAVCLGFATLYAALCRSIDIPCNVVSGYALGVGQDTEWTDTSIHTDYQNHAWNEAYVDGRWVIVDTTWDTQNKIQSGEWISGEQISHIYFDSNLQYFSQTHKILEYAKRR